jgi:hypothetical protein
MKIVFLCHCFMQFRKLKKKNYTLLTGKTTTGNRMKKKKVSLKLQLSTIRKRVSYFSIFNLFRLEGGLVPGEQQWNGTEYKIKKLFPLQHLITFHHILTLIFRSD